MKILVAQRNEVYCGQPVETYSISMMRELRAMGHEVIAAPKHPPVTKDMYNGIDLLLDVDCGRDETGALRWHGEAERPPCKSAVYLIDSHGHPEAHRRLAKKYDHVFFAVWDKRELFVKHPSAHWCPNFTDEKWFDYEQFTSTPKKFQFGFFGSKGGLERANNLKQIADQNHWNYSVRQVGVQSKHRWPATGVAMSECEVLFNHAQKHDGPNLRVMESMLINRPLICDQDPRSGLDLLFKPWEHYIPYQYDFTGLEEAMRYSISHPEECAKIAQAAYHEVKTKHLVQNRLAQILEVCS